VLDAGCGDGTLAGAATARGGVVRAVDRDRDCVARARAAGVSAELAMIEDITGSYAVVLANLWADELVRLRAVLCARVAPGGRLYATGARLWQAKRLARAFAQLELVRVEGLGGWCGLELVKPGLPEPPATH
jgi:ribosomal protein L11 methyltransferase